jgi:hypothetical protein
MVEYLFSICEQIVGQLVMNTERVFEHEDGSWYFRIRGNATMGPYTTFREANDSRGRYVESCRRQSDLAPSWPRWLHPRFWTRRLSGTPAANAETEPSPTEV